MKMFLDEIVVRLHNSMTIVETTALRTLKGWVFMVCELYLNKAVIKEISAFYCVYLYLKEWEQERDGERERESKGEFFN